MSLGDKGALSVRAFDLLVEGELAELATVAERTPPPAVTEHPESVEITADIRGAFSAICACPE